MIANAFERTAGGWLIQGNFDQISNDDLIDLLLRPASSPQIARSVEPSEKQGDLHVAPEQQIEQHVVVGDMNEQLTATLATETENLWSYRRSIPSGTEKKTPN